MNKVFLMGHLTRDVELKMSNDVAYARCGIAINRRKKDEVDFFNLTAFGKTAEVMSKYLAKGSKVLIEGRLQTSTYDKNGVKVTATDVIVEQCEFADSKKKAADNDGFGGTPVDDSDTPF